MVRRLECLHQSFGAVRKVSGPQSMVTRCLVLPILFVLHAHHLPLFLSGLKEIVIEVSCPSACLDQVTHWTLDRLIPM